jgi:hypothetical protein
MDVALVEHREDTTAGAQYLADVASRYWIGPSFGATKVLSAMLTRISSALCTATSRVAMAASIFA